MSDLKLHITRPDQQLRWRRKPGDRSGFAGPIRERLCAIYESILFPHYKMRNFRHHDNIALFPELGVVYNRIKKSGNSTITAFLAELSGHTFASSVEVKLSTRRPYVFDPVSALRFRALKSVSFVRDPYARVLSAFRDKVGRGREQFQKYPGWDEDTPEGFTCFVGFLERGGLYADRHWWPQTELLYKPADSFDFIGRIEHLADDMACFLEQIGLQSIHAQSLSRPHRVSEHQTQSSDALDVFYTEALKARVARLYARDFEAFKYPV